MNLINRLRKKFNYFFEVIIALSLTKLVTRLIFFRLRKVIRSSGEYSVAFFPYASPDSWALHLTVARFLGKARGPKNEVHFFSDTYKIPIQNQINYFIDAPCSKLNYAQKIAYFNLKSMGDPNLARGIIDQYRRMCNREEFFNETLLDFKILEEISDSINRAEYVVNNFRLIVLTDLAYAFNRAIISRSRIYHCRVLVLSADGRFFEPEWDENFAIDMVTWSSILQKFNSLNLDRKYQQYSLAKNYAETRFLGKSRDKESQLAFQKISEAKTGDFGATVFLHCIRDASNDNPFKTPGNEDYFLWTRNLIRFIAQNKLDWQIKLHPHRAQYPDEDYIIANLLADENLNFVDSVTEASTSAILENGSTIITFSGTITVEAAVRGIKSICFGDRFPAGICLSSTFQTILSDISSLESEPTLSERDIEHATLILFGIARESQLAFSMTLSDPIQPNSSALYRKFAYYRSLRELFDKSDSVDFMKTLQAILDQVESMKFGADSEK